MRKILELNDTERCMLKAAIRREIERAIKKDNEITKGVVSIFTDMLDRLEALR